MFHLQLPIPTYPSLHNNDFCFFNGIFNFLIKDQMQSNDPKTKNTRVDRCDGQMSVG